jgi:hypothetical protein
MTLSACSRPIGQEHADRTAADRLQALRWPTRGTAPRRTAAVRSDGSNQTVACMRRSTRAREGALARPRADRRGFSNLQLASQRLSWARPMPSVQYRLGAAFFCSINAH